MTEWDEFTGRLQAVDSVEVRPRVSGSSPPSASTRAPSSARATCCSRSIRVRSRPKSIGCAPSSLARGPPVSARTPSSQRAERLRAENAISNEEHDRRAAFAQESAAQAAAVEAALRAAELNLEFTQVTSPINGRVGRAIVTEGNLVSSGPGEATLLTTVVSLDPVYALLRRRRADLPEVHRRRRGQRPANRARSIDLPIRMALANDEGSRAMGQLDFLDNQLDGATGTIRGARRVPQYRRQC